MNTDAFWELIEDCRRQATGRDERLAWLHTELSQRPVAEVVRFQASLEEVTDDGYSWELWAAAERIFGGWCSDDGFFYFRLWLVALGRVAFERALAEPDTLADAPEVRKLVGCPRSAWGEDWPEWEELDYVAATAFESLTGTHDEGNTFYDLVEAEDGRSTKSDAEPAGIRWDVRDEAEVTQRLRG
ncbi:DUF4240 domain-containing protein [Kitasatospora sp. NPDC058032]|uniref:DUF4240 domain-containing protein n=1 Tax=Kitasatospora sp. NPDC058032 TaxID=3346307 RepID=UPI0036D8D554